MNEKDCIVVELKPKEPFRNWLNALFKDEFEKEEDTNKLKALKEFRLIHLRENKTLFLIPKYDNEEQILAFLVQNCTKMFETELELWYSDKTTWPPSRDIEEFRKWFEIGLNPLIYDLTENTSKNEDPSK